MVWSSDVCSSDLCTALEDDQPALVRFARAAFASYFDRQENLDDPAVLIAVADAEGLDGGAIAEAAVSDAVKARLRANTDEVIARGGNGSPPIFRTDARRVGKEGCSPGRCRWSADSQIK